MRTLVKIDLSKKMVEEPRPIFHNRWHPDIPAMETVKSGEIFKVECFDFTGGQMRNDDTVDDILNVDLTVTHPLSGPIAVEGAQPGDAVKVEILDVQPFEAHNWGYTCIMDLEHGGGGFMGDIMKGPCKAIWDFEGIYASSRHIPGVRFAGMIHPGIVGTAPSAALLKDWNRREGELIAANSHCNPPLAYPPLVKGAMVGLAEKDKALAKRIKEEGARTVPSREHGGNCDIKNLTRGSTIWLPVYVEGANISYGDIHFSQADGEIAFCGAIETCGVITTRVTLVKGGVQSMGLRNPLFLTSPVEPKYWRYLTFEGISVDDEGKQRYLDPAISFRNAVLNALAYLQKLGYTKEQSYLILTAAPNESRINNIVDVPNSCVSIAIPTDIFDFDITPGPNGPKNMGPRGGLAPCVGGKR